MALNTHEEYFAIQPLQVRTLLVQMQKEIEMQVPGALRCISYNMPAFKQRRPFIYFAAFKNHIGVYPPVTQDQTLIAQTAAYRGPKGNLSFPYDQELPLALIGRVAAALAAQYASE